MNARRILRIAAAASLALLVVSTPAVLAQEAAVQSQAAQQTPQAAQGPLVFKPVQNGWVVAPEVKLTDFSDHFGTLFGAYGGWLNDESFLVGAGIYWLVDGAADRGMTYGGLMLGWYVPIGHVARFGARGLLGAGSGTTGVTFTYPAWDGGHKGHDWNPGMPGSGQPVTWHGAYSTNFLVGEPEASFVVKLSDWASINASVGYRFVGWANGLEDRFRGPTGSIAIRFGGR